MLSLSVALCTYNGERYLPEQLESLAGQSVLPGELVLCDDGSTDGTLALAERFAEHAPFPVRVVRNAKNLGSTENFAHCIGLCQGDVIALADQDDIWLPQKLEILLRTFEDDPTVTCAFSNAALMDAHSQLTGEDAWTRFLFTPALRAQIAAGDALDVLLQVPVVTGAAAAFRATAARAALPISRPWIHDAWLATVAALLGRVVPVEPSLIQYRIHGAQQLGLAAESGRQRLRRLGLGGFLVQEKATMRSRYEHMAETYTTLSHFVDARELGDAAARGAIRDKAAFAQRVLALLDSPRPLRLGRALSMSDGFRRFSPHGVRTILRLAAL